MHGSESIVYEKVVLQDFRFRFVFILKIVELIMIKTHSYIHYKAIFDDQTDCMSSTLPFMPYFAKTFPVDFLRTTLTRQLACLEWESGNTLLRVCYPLNYLPKGIFNS